MALAQDGAFGFADNQFLSGVWVSPPNGKPPGSSLSSRMCNMLRIAESLVGRLTVLADHNWIFGESIVAEAQLPGGQRIFLKSHGARVNYEAELAVYQEVLPHLEGGALRLLAHSDEHMLLIVNALGGTRVDWIQDEPTYVLAHRLAGGWLRQFHSATPPRYVDDWIDQQRTNLNEWISRDRRRVLSRDENDFARHVIDSFPAETATEVVWAHRDWGPRNWILANGHLEAFDFEHSRYEHWTRDVAPLWFGQWAHRTDLAEAFLLGYGRRPSTSDLSKMRVLAVIWCVTTISWASHAGASEIAADARNILTRMRRSLDS